MRFWVSASVDEPPHQICSYTLLFSLFLRFLYIINPPLCTSALMQSHSLHQTDLAYLMDTWFMIHMYLLLFLVSPMCPLLQSDQSWALTLHGQALSITLPYAHFLVYHLYLTCLYFTFRRTSSEKSHTLAYTSFPQNWDLALMPHLALISHYFASHHTATIPPSLLATLHLETIPCPQIAPPQSPIGFILRSPAP